MSSKDLQRTVYDEIELINGESSALAEPNVTIGGDEMPATLVLPG